YSSRQTQASPIVTEKRRSKRLAQTLKRIDWWAWANSGQLLLECKTSEKWRGEASSFSAWLHFQANTQKLQPSVLWRSLCAVRFYESLGREYEGLKLPHLKQLQSKTSAEHL